MLEEEFSDALEGLKPESLDSEQVALAVYWKKTDELQKFWDEEVVGAVKFTVVTLFTSVILGAIYLACGSAPLGSFLDFIRIMSATVGIMTGALTLGGFVVTPLELLRYRSNTHSLPPIPDNYDPEMGESVAGLHVKMQMQEMRLLGANALHKNFEEIEAGRAQLQAYQLATVKDVYELSEPEEFEQFNIDS